MIKLSDIDLDLRLPPPPLLLVAVVVIGIFVPMTIASAIWYKRNKTTADPPYHIFLDMDASIAVKAQEASVVFEDQRGARPYAPGAVAWGRQAHHPDPTMLKDDDLAYRGFATDPVTGDPVRVGQGEDAALRFLPGFPPIVDVNLRFLEHGQTQYNTYCFTCHGRDGLGQGPVADRASRLASQVGNPTGTVWTAPAVLTDPKFGEALYPNGQLYHTITHGAGNMQGYGPQTRVEDRWAIVAYVRALQATDRSDATVEGRVPHDHDGDGVPDH